MQKTQRKLALLLLALPLVCAGCIGGDVQDFLRYDPKEDAFWFLELYTNLHATNQADQDHLASVWKRRDSILVKPFNFTRVSPQGTLELNVNFDWSAPFGAIERTGEEPIPNDRSFEALGQGPGSRGQRTRSRFHSSRAGPVLHQ